MTVGGRPAATPPGHPGLPPSLENPYTLFGEKVRDPASWQLWWEFNQDVYLQLSKIDTRATTSAGGDFFLGAGQRDLPVPGGRADMDTVRDQILPSLMAVVGKGGELGMLREVIVATAKASRRADSAGFETSLRHFLGKNPDIEVRRAAALGFGIMQANGQVSVLQDLATDHKRSHELLEVESIDPELRAHAIYALALLGSSAESLTQRQNVVDALVAVAGQDGDEDLRAMAVMGVGLVPLESDGDHEACTCGTCEVGDPASSLENQISWVTNHYLDHKQPAPVRAQAVLALGRLAAASGDELPEELELTIVDFLIDSLAKNNREPQTVRHSAILGLSLIGDADEDVADAWVRWALLRSLRTGDRLERRWALMGLGAVGSRPGTGDEPFAATDECRSILLTRLSKGKSSERPWAALGLGVLGHWLQVNGQPLSKDASLALQASVRNRRNAEETGALALAVGIRHQAEAVPALLRDLDRTKDASTRGYLALAIGLAGDRSAIDPLQGMLEAKRLDPDLRGQVGLALGLLSDASIVPALIGMLENEDQDVRRGAVQALGFVGDARGAAALGKMLEPVQHDLVRRDAAIALGRMADDRALPWRGVLAVGTNYLTCPPSLTSAERSGALDLH